MREERIQAEEIKHIVVDTNTASESLCIPLEATQNPRTPLQAKFSIPYTVANAIRKQWVSLEDFAPQAIKDPGTLALAHKVSSRLNPEYESIRGMTPGKVELQTNSGKVHSRLENFPYGHPNNPLSPQDATRKFRDCVARAAKPPRQDDVEKLIQMLGRLETVANVSEIARLLG